MQLPQSLRKETLFHINVFSASPASAPLTASEGTESRAESRACRPLPSPSPCRTRPLGPHGSPKEPESPRSAAAASTPPLGSAALCPRGQRVTLSLQPPRALLHLTPEVPAWLDRPPGWRRAWDLRRASPTEPRGGRKSPLLTEREVLTGFQQGCQDFSGHPRGKREREVTSPRRRVSVLAHGSHSPPPNGPITN